MVTKPKIAPARTAAQMIDEALKKPATTVVAESGTVTTIDPPAAEAAPASTPGSDIAGTFASPWEEGNERIINFFQIRMPEPLKMKLDWLHATQKVAPGSKRLSTHHIALTALERELNRLIAKAQKEG